MTNEERAEFDNRFIQHVGINEVLPKVGISKRGTVINYHTGFLCADIPSELASQTEGQHTSDLRFMRTRMYELHKQGIVELLQKKVSKYVYQYLAYVK